MPDFSKRSTEAEMMDDFALDGTVINPIMDELEVVNKLLGGYAVFFDAFKRIRLQPGDTISDWGCGGGDSLRVLAKWARSKNISLKFVGIDATESAVVYANAHSKEFPEISYIHSDVLNGSFKDQQFDVVISSLFTHHFEDQSWKQLIKTMLSQARKAVIINDL